MGKTRVAACARAIIVVSGLIILPVHSAGTDAVAVELSRIGISNPADNLPSAANSAGLTAEQAKRLVAMDKERSRQLVRSQFCDQAPHAEPCAELPNDNTDFSSLFVYIFLSSAAQNSFDIFSWQTFLALNWPLTDTGETADTLAVDHEHKPRWSSFLTPQQIYAPEQRNPVCTDAANDSGFTLETSSYLQPTGHPLIDQNLNYVVYDVRVNAAMSDYIKANSLDSVAGQKRFMQSGRQIDFPVGYYDDPVSKRGGEPGSIAIKSAWKILDQAAGDTPSRYFTVNGNITIPAEHSETGQALCVQAKLGLAGMHIMRRGDSGNGRQWIWSTFEHIDNAPVASNNRRPNDILHDEPFAQGCKGPADVTQDYAFYNANCADCSSNMPEIKQWLWSPDPPYTGHYAASGGKPTQVVRCWDIFEGTQLVNAEWQKKLKGTVWANYRSISAQWKGANRGKMVPEGEVPRYMTNPVLETFEQHKLMGSCMSCHATARSTAGQNTGFSFLPSLVARYQ